MFHKLAILIPCLAFATSSQCQNKKLIPLIEEYFRTTPYDKEFSGLVNFYVADSDFVIDSNSKSTDTSIFYLRGYHKTFNPFSFPVDHLVFVIRQSEDSLELTAKLKERNFELTVPGFIDSSEKSIQILKKELITITERFGRFLNEPGYIYSNEKSTYPLEFYFFNMLTTGWTYLPYYQKSLYITLRLRFIVKMNRIK